jgi:hypothetical protein
MIKIYYLLFIIISSALSVSALGISPAIKNVHFVPNEEVKILFYALDTTKDSIYDVYLGGGDLINYSYLSADFVKGGGSIVLTIKFPEKMSKPGDHIISVVIKERSSEESFISTVVEVGATVKVFVSYPGIYGDMFLSIPDGNVDEKIPVELQVINRGDKVLDVTNVFIDIISDGGDYVKKLDFTPVSIPVSGERYFRKYLDTKGMEPGNYIGTAKIYYTGNVNEINKSFRVGSLFVNITNFTNYIVGNGIQRFYVTLENKWNSPISGVFVDVNLSNEIYGMVFRTPSIDLKPWEKKMVESYLDAEDLDGSYNLILNASYYGKSTTVYGNLFVGKDYSFIVYSISAVIAIIFFIILYFVLGRFFLKRGKK